MAMRRRSTGIGPDRLGRSRRQRVVADSTWTPRAEAEGVSVVMYCQLGVAAVAV